MPTYTVTDGQSLSLSFQNTTPQPEVDTINVSGAATVNIGTSRGNTVEADVNLASNTTLTSDFILDGSSILKVTGDASSKLILSGPTGAPSSFSYLGASTLFGVDVSGPGSLTVNGNSVEFARGVSSDVSVGFNNGAGLASATIDQPNAFKGSIGAQGGTIHLENLGAATDYDLSNGVLNIYGGAGDALLDTLRLSGDTSKLAFTHNGPEVNVYGSFNPNVPVVGAALVQHVAPPVTPPPAPQIVAAHDNTTGADLPDTSSAYSGPVAGIASQFINITPDNLNIMAKADSLFIKTGSGNDAVALHGGTNVVDAGTGSNFLTSGGGFDTFFLDARNIPAASSAAGPVPGAIWDTIQAFGHGDAVTLFGIGPSTALVWQKNEGAVGHAGLTLHANMPNGAEASLTLAGIDSKASVALSYGSTGGASYLYVKSI